MGYAQDYDLGNWEDDCDIHLDADKKEAVAMDKQ